MHCIAADEERYFQGILVGPRQQDMLTIMCVFLALITVGDALACLE
jgi:hypothetical protein